ncbi:hypothetical protein ACN47E_001331 [Coniothyrium glycines]
MDRYRPTYDSSDSRRRRRPSSPGPPASASTLDLTLPKNFATPLTCFFWHSIGTCRKRDADCAYAHHDTGYYAKGPVNLPSGMVSVAGSNIQRNLPHLTKTTIHEDGEQDLRHREVDLACREEELCTRETALMRREEHFLKWRSKIERELVQREKRVTLYEAQLSKGSRYKV